MKILIVMALSILAGVFYRMGGSGNYNRLWRIMGVPFLQIMALIALFGAKMAYWWVYLLYFGLSCGFISTYWDFLFKDVDNFFMHGFMIGVAGFILIIFGVHWPVILIRSIALSVFMGVWCLIWKWDIAEEVGRGSSIILSMLLLTL